MSLHENPHVVTAISSMETALSALNAAGEPYNLTGVGRTDNPYSLVAGALALALNTAFPDLGAGRILATRDRERLTVTESVAWVRSEKERRASLLAPFVRNLRPARHSTDQMYVFSNGWAALVATWHSDEGDPWSFGGGCTWQIRAGRVCDGSFDEEPGEIADLAFTSGDYVSGHAVLAECLQEVMDLPARS